MKIWSIILAAGLAVAAVASEAVAQGYPIQRGDTLRIEVREDPSLNREVLVMPDGRISLPQIGTVQAAGRTVEQIGAALVGALSPNFTAPPNVYVALAERYTPPPPVAPLPPVTVTSYAMGEVESPGAIEMRPGTTLLQFISQAGGFTRFAATNRVQLRRVDPKTGQEHVYVIDLRAVERGRAMPRAIVLTRGDVVYVPTRRLFE